MGVFGIAIVLIVQGIMDIMLHCTLAVKQLYGIWQIGVRGMVLAIYNNT
ncbi:hypothetical protein [Aquiflexum lacus]|nr:hypothetical protein [Aquiflexum lacus]